MITQYLIWVTGSAARSCHHDLMLKGNRKGWVVTCLLVAAAAACSSSSSTTPGGTGTDTQAQKTVGAAGGQVSTSDGALTVTIPAGALPADVKITIEEIATAPDGSIGKAYEIGPSGTQFAVPVTLAFKYAGADLLGNDPASLEAATIVNGDWVPLTADVVDLNAQTASGTTMHLSPYGLHGKGNGNGKDSGSATDATSANDATTPDGSATDASGSSDSAFDAAGCSMKLYQVGSCANHPLQLTCPGGTFVASCTDAMGMQGFTLECCPNDGG